MEMGPFEIFYGNTDKNPRICGEARGRQWRRNQEKYERPSSVCHLCESEIKSCPGAVGGGWTKSNVKKDGKITVRKKTR